MEMWNSWVWFSSGVAIGILAWLVYRLVNAPRERRALKMVKQEYEDKIGNLERELSLTKLAKDGMFKLVSSMERQRNEWNAMFHRDAVKHVATAAVYDRELSRQRVWLARLLKEVNGYRKAEGKDPIDTPKKLAAELAVDALPAGKVNEYVAELKQLYTDGAPEFAAERDGAPRPPDIEGGKLREEFLAMLQREREFW